MRLIDADRLHEQYEAAMRELVQSTNCENISLEALSLLCGANLIANAPTVEAVPVVHGKWEFSTIPDELYNCSICGAGCWYYDYRAHVTKSNYCPSCGAKMDLEEQNEG